MEPTMIGIADINVDGIVHWSDIQMQSDIVAFAVPEIAGLTSLQICALCDAVPALPASSLLPTIARGEGLGRCEAGGAARRITAGLRKAKDL